MIGKFICIATIAASCSVGRNAESGTSVSPLPEAGAPVLEPKAADARAPESPVVLMPTPVTENDTQAPVEPQAPKPDPAGEPTIVPPTVVERTLVSTRVCDNAERGSFEPHYFKVTTKLFSDATAESHVLLRYSSNGSTTVVTFDENLLGGLPGENLYTKPSETSKLLPVPGHGLAYANPQYRIQFSQDDREAPLLFADAVKARVDGVAQPIDKMKCVKQ